VPEWVNVQVPVHGLLVAVTVAVGSAADGPIWPVDPLHDAGSDPVKWTSWLPPLPYAKSTLPLGMIATCIGVYVKLLAVTF
jgi:hypothetical protein